MSLSDAKAKVICSLAFVFAVDYCPVGTAILPIFWRQCQSRYDNVGRRSDERATSGAASGGDEVLARAGSRGFASAQVSGLTGERLAPVRIERSKSTADWIQRRGLTGDVA
jgi:hypothetical protein